MKWDEVYTEDCVAYGVLAVVAIVFMVVWFAFPIEITIAVFICIAVFIGIPLLGYYVNKLIERIMK